MAGGMMRFIPNHELDAQTRQEAQQGQDQPLIQGLAAHIRTCWSTTHHNRREIEDRMIKSLRQRDGQYDAETLDLIAQQGGSKVFMMLTEVKCRAAESWLRDILGDLPWDIQPTPVPSLPPGVMDFIDAQIQTQVQAFVQASGIEPDSEDVEAARDYAAHKIRGLQQKAAEQAMSGMRAVMADQMLNGKLKEAFHEFISDLVTYPGAILKGPVVARQAYLSWGKDLIKGGYAPMVAEQFAPAFKRVSPFDFFPETNIDDLSRGFTLERHALTRPELAALKGSPGYDDVAVAAALMDYDGGHLNGWLDMDHVEWARRRLENRQGGMLMASPDPEFMALEFWGPVNGRKLLDWGMEAEQVPDPDQEYEITGWLIGSWVIKATLNSDPLREKPYHMTSYIKIPGALWGKGIPEVMRDIQQVCNATARAMVNNIAIASGPQVEINLDRLPPEQKITRLTPWQIWQMNGDPMGTKEPAVHFHQPDMQAAILMQVYEKFARIADEVTSIPAYVYGDTDIQGAGRTASGLSMLMGSAGKGIRQIIMFVDRDVLQPLMRQLYRFNMRYHPDESIKGDAEVVSKGTELITKEQLNMRRIEFLQTTANPFDMQIVGLKGRAAILREVAKGLEMDVDDIVPSPEDIKVMEFQQRQMQAQQAAMGVPPGGPPSAQGPSQAKPSGRPAAATMDQGASVGTA